MSDFSDILVRVGADVEPLKKGLKSGSSELDKFGSNVADAAKKTALITAAATAAAAAIGVSLVKNSMSAIDAQAKLAKQLDTSSKSIANLELAASLSGISIDQVGAAAKALNVRLAEAAGGTGEAVEALKELGLRAKDLADLDLDQKISVLNTAIKDNIEPTRQAAIAADLFGSRAGAAISQLDAKTLSDAAAQVERLGLAISDVDAAKVEAANDSIELLKRSADGFIQQLTVELAPAINAAAKAISEQFGAASGDMSEGVKMAANAAIDAFANVLDGAAGLVGFVEDNPDVAQYGVLGYMILGKKGAAIGGVIGGVFGMVKDEMKAMGIQADESLDPVVKRIAELERGLQKAQEAYDRYEFVNKFIESSAALEEISLQASIMQMELRELKASIEEGSDAQTQLNQILDTGSESGTSLSEAMKSVAAAIREAKTAADETDLGGIGGLTVEELGDPAEDVKVKYNQDVIDNMRAAWDKHHTASIKATDDAERKKAEIQQWYSGQSVSAISKALGDVSTLMESENKKQFEIGKKAAAAQTVIDTIASAQAAFKSLAGIPIVGPALGAAAAGAAAIAGMARLNQINSTSFSGGGSVGNAHQGAGLMPSTAAATAGTSGQAGSGAGQSQTMFVEGIDPSSLFSGGMVRDLAKKLLEFERDGGTVRL